MKDWTEILNTTFDNNIPEYSRWEDYHDIIKILNLISSEKKSNHMYFPDGGGMDLLSACQSNELGLIELHNGFTDILNPLKLTFHKTNDSNESYFRLEMKEIKPMTEGNNTDFSEGVCEISPLKYISLHYLDLGEYDNMPLPSSARQVTRRLKGSIIIVGKGSVYNGLRGVYNGEHNKYNEEEFYDFYKRVTNQ